LFDICKLGENMLKNQVFAKYNIKLSENPLKT